jgi:hypothetical protein
MKYLIVLTLLSIILIGCGEAKQADSETPGPTQPTTVATTIVQITTTTAQQAAQLDPEIKKIIDQNSKLKSMNYYYYETDGAQGYGYYIKGSNVKVILAGSSIYKAENLFDTVYLDLNVKSAFGYCLNRQRCGPNPSIKTLNFNDYYRKTPLDWVQEITSGSKTGEEQIGGRDTYIISFSRAGTDYKVWLDTYFGVPLKFQEGQKTYEYREAKFNMVSDNDVVPG